MKTKFFTIIILIAMLSLVFSGVAMAATYIPGPIEGSGGGGTCPQTYPWTKIDAPSGSASGDWGSFTYGGNWLTYDVNQYYTLYLCIKYSDTNDGWVIVGPEAGTVTTQTGQDISHVSWYFVYEPQDEGQWCSPGYWRQEHHLDAWAATGYSPGDEYLDTGFTLWEILQDPTTFARLGLFEAVGDLLSGAHPDVDFLGVRVEDSCPLD